MTLPAITSLPTALRHPRGLGQCEMPFDFLNSIHDCYCRPGNAGFTESHGQAVAQFLAGNTVRTCGLNCATSSYGLCPSDCPHNPQMLPGNPKNPAVQEKTTMCDTKSIAHHVSFIAQSSACDDEPVDLIGIAALNIGQNPNTYPESLLTTDPWLNTAIAALFHTMPSHPPTSNHARYPGCPDNPRDLPELRAIAAELNESGCFRPSTLTISYVRSLSNLIPPSAALLWATEADKYIFTATDARRAFGHLGDHGSPEQDTDTAAQAAAFATVRFYRNHGHLPEHHALAACVTTAITTPDPEQLRASRTSATSHQDDGDELPF